MNTDIALNKLIISSQNVRTLSTTKGEDIGLVASIQHLGILNNLVVIKEGKDCYEIIAGSRRFAALQALREKGLVDPDYMVPCLIRDNDSDVVEVSLAENVQRSAMHPADEFVAFAKMKKGGRSVDQIAERFGVTKKLVKQRLALGCVDEKLLGLYRQGKLNLEQLMAFTVCDNKERQLACYKELSGGHFWPNTIKQWLLGESISSSTGIGAFVGRSAYTKAGGVVSSDLFQDSVYFSDAELVMTLAVTKLEKKADALRQMNRWLWVEVCVETDTLDYLQLQPELVGVPDKKNDTLKALSLELEALEKQGAEQGWPEEIDQQYDVVEEKLDALQQSINDQYLKYTEEQMSYSGCVVSFDHAGKLKIHEGLARPSDVPQPEATDTVEEPKTDNKAISGALSADLGLYRQHMAQAALLRHSSLANDVLRYSVCVQILSGASWKGRDLLDITCSIVRSDTSRNDSESSRASGELKSAKAALVTEWMAFNDEGERFKAFCALSEKQKSDLLTYCIAQSVTVRTRGQNKAQDALVDTLDIPFHQYWRPTKDNYLGRLSAPLLIDLVGQNVRSEAWCEEAGNKRKSEIVAEMETFFTQVDNNELASTWVPAEF